MVGFLWLFIWLFHAQRFVIQMTMCPGSLWPNVQGNSVTCVQEPKQTSKVWKRTYNWHDSQNIKTWGYPMNLMHCIRDLSLYAQFVRASKVTRWPLHETGYWSGWTMGLIHQGSTYILSHNCFTLFKGNLEQYWKAQLTPATWIKQLEGEGSCLSQTQTHFLLQSLQTMWRSGSWQ